MCSVCIGCCVTDLEMPGEKAGLIVRSTHVTSGELVPVTINAGCISCSGKRCSLFVIPELEEQPGWGYEQRGNYNLKEME